MASPEVSVVRTGGTTGAAAEDDVVDRGEDSSVLEDRFERVSGLVESVLVAVVGAFFEPPTMLNRKAPSPAATTATAAMMAIVIHFGRLGSIGGSGSPSVR